jgi:hypothetical protein
MPGNARRNAAKAPLDGTRIMLNATFNRREEFVRVLTVGKPFRLKLFAVNQLS